jgi:hypothetical protein
MSGRLTIQVVGRDDDYLALDIRAASERFAGSARVYASLDELTDLAEQISGFPQSTSDERNYEFGTQEPGWAGGFCSLRFYCIDGSGHARLGVVLIDDKGRHWPGSASFGFEVFATEIDQFVRMLTDLNDRRVREAILGAVS